MKGEKGIVEPSFIYLPGVSGGEEIAKETGVEFFSTPVELGVSPITKVIFLMLCGLFGLTNNTAQWSREGH